MRTALQWFTAFFLGIAACFTAARGDAWFAMAAGWSWGVVSGLAIAAELDKRFGRKTKRFGARTGDWTEKP